MRTTDRRDVSSAVVVIPGLLGLTLGLGLPARAETTLCTPITSLPATITVQGIYCLTSDFSVNMATGNAITIDANNVTIDLNGHKIGNLAAGPGTEANGIYARQRQNITIRNGTLRGFYFAVLLSDPLPYTTSQGHVVEDLRADQSTFGGITVQGRGCIVRRNQVVSTGGTTVFGAAGYAMGIAAYGHSARVIDNDVITAPNNNTFDTYGLYLLSSDGMAINNRISHFGVGIRMRDGIKYRDNLTMDVLLAYDVGVAFGGIDIGNNN